MIEVSINGEKRSVSEGMNLAKILDELGVREQVLLVELNGQLVRREQFDEERVESGDILELIRVAGGG